MSNSKTHSQMDDLRGMAEDAKSAAKETMGAAAQKAQQMGSDMKHVVQDRLEDLQGLASEYYKEGRAKMQDLEHSIENRVRAQPLTYLLVAGSLGFALGFLLTKHR